MAFVPVRGGGYLVAPASVWGTSCIPLCPPHLRAIAARTGGVAHRSGGGHSSSPGPQCLCGLPWLRLTAVFRQKRLAMRYTLCLIHSGH